MDKESERPTPAKGQQWQHEGHPKIWTIREVADSGPFPVGFTDDDGTPGSWELDMRRCTFLGYAPGFAPAPGSRQAERPKPAAGQRWRDLGSDHDGRDKYLFTGGKPFKLVERWASGPRHVWSADSERGCYWPDHCFTDGRLEFVDHGSTQSEPAPTAPHDQTLCTYCQGGIACPEFARMFKAGNVSVIAPTSTPRAAVPPKPLDRCTWNTQAATGMLTGRCTSLVSHAKSPYCETHIFEAMEARRKLAPVEQPAHFHQSHPLIAGGVISLRAGRGGR